MKTLCRYSTIGKLNNICSPLMLWIPRANLKFIKYPIIPRFYFRYLKVVFFQPLFNIYPIIFKLTPWLREELLQIFQNFPKNGIKFSGISMILEYRQGRSGRLSSLQLIVPYSFQILPGFPTLVSILTDSSEKEGPRLLNIYQSTFGFPGHWEV